MLRLAAVIALFVVQQAPVIAGPGHDHGPAPAAAVPIDEPRLESSGTDLELVATAKGHTLTIFLDRSASNEPVSGATIEVSADGTSLVAKQIADGTYQVDADWLDVPGVKALTFTVTTGADIDLLNGTLEIPARPHAAAAPSATTSEILGSGLFWLAVGLAGVAGFLLALAVRPIRQVPDASEPASHVPGSGVDGAPERLKSVAALLICAILAGAAFAGGAYAHGDGGHDGAAQAAVGSAPRKLPEGYVFVPKPSQRLLQVRTAIAKAEAASIGSELLGTVIPDPGSVGQVQAPMDGQIELSERGISYVGQRVTTGEVLAALVPNIPVADLGTMQQLRADVDGKLRIAEQKLSRLSRIAGVVAQSEIDDTRAELDALREQKRVLAPKGVEKILLKAPVSGVISVANVRAGQVVALRDTLFEIVDPKRQWVEAIDVAGHDSGGITEASAIGAKDKPIPLTFVGEAPALRQKSLPLLFRIEPGHDALTIGATVKVVIQRGATEQGVIVPNSAVVRAPNGLAQVWAKVSAERFKPVPVKTMPLDGARLLVTGGIADGTRIVTEGAEFINQVR